MKKPGKYALTRQQQKYIIKHRLTKSVPQMAIFLDVSPKAIFAYLRKNKLEWLHVRTPRRPKDNIETGFFNVNENDGNWIV